MISIKYCCNFLRNYFFFAKWKAAWWMHEFPSSFFLDFLFCLNQNHMHTSFYIFFVHSQFYFWKLKMRSLSKCFFVCIKCIETVMIRCASAHTHKLQNFYFFFPSLFNCWQMELTRKVYLFSDISPWLKITEKVSFRICFH